MHKETDGALTTNMCRSSYQIRGRVESVIYFLMKNEQADEKDLVGLGKVEGRFTSSHMTSVSSDFITSI